GKSIKTIETKAPGLRPALSPDGTQLATVGPNDKVLLWDAATGNEVATLVGLDDTPEVLTFTGDGQWVVAGGRDKGWVKAWELGKSEKPASLVDQTEATTHKGAVNAIAADRQGRYVATAGNDGLVKIWDVNINTGESSTLKVEAGTSSHWGFRNKLTGTVKATAVGFTPDGQRLIAGWSDGTLKGCDPEAKKNAEFSAKDTKLGPIKRLVFSPNSERVAAIDVGGTAKVWDPGLQNVQLEIPGQVNAVAFFKSDDRFQGHDMMGSGGNDGVVQIWEMFFKNVRAKLIGHDGPVVGLAFSPDGKRLVTADSGGTVIIWSIGEVKPGL